MARRIIGWLAVGWLIPSVAYADHHGMVMASEDHDAPSVFGASVSLVAAQYSTMDYGGDYEGVVPAASWSLGRFAAGASLPLYRIEENGLIVRGVGDLVVHAQVAVLRYEELVTGVSFAASYPTGNDLNGLGMGHDMLMPAAWVAWRRDRIALAGSAGYSRALVDAGGSHHDHGPWPLVEPMNMSELTWSGSGEVALGGGVRCGARLSGGVPFGVLPGHERVVGTLRAAWAVGRVDNAFELQAGLVGDPFTVRGVVETALRF